VPVMVPPLAVAAMKAKATKNIGARRLRRFNVRCSARFGKPSHRELDAR
jgi:hypothetical protein